jgi:hypothetical protein
VEVDPPEVVVVGEWTEVDKDVRNKHAEKEDVAEGQKRQECVRPEIA